MRPDRWRQVDELFEAALEHEGEARTAFLDRACAGDPSLRREVEKMLGFDERAAHFIESDVFGVAAGLMTGAPPAAHSGQDPTEIIGPEAKPSASITSDSIDDARFVPGDVLAGRYRIGGLLGRGGMGEVYRADDLKLKQPVALKFLPERLLADGAALARFYREVSVARRISHRHVCRVYDVGESEGQHFISMEYVRGEELSSLLKRIGRLPPDKAVEIARQLCAGLSAVHDEGVLHRDLKPANVMVDERGDVRVTDFGIAALADEAGAREALMGTPAYMSPEQLEGRELSARSDIYSLGLVIYEVFTGRKAFEAPSLPELIRLRRSDTTPTRPTELVADLDPLVERVIFRCLERDPEKRPASALQVAAALPGGDPLAAALAAGETPSPEMVAAAPKEGALRPAAAVALLASLLVLLAAVCLLSKQVALYRMVPLDKSPEVLNDRAAEVVKRLGHTAPPADSAYGMGLDREYLRHMGETDASPARWEGLRSGQPAAIYFWYRQSPRPLEVRSGGEVREEAHGDDTPGVAAVTLDTLGRLRSLSVVPPRADDSPADGRGPADWAPLFSEAGLDPSQFRPSASNWVPPHAYTERAAWDGAYPSRPGMRIHVEAAAYAGRPVYFEIIEPWDRPPAPSDYLGDAGQRTLGILILATFITTLVGGALLAWRNLRLGRGDRKGAFRLAAFIFALFLAGWAFSAHHVPTEEVAHNFLDAVRSTLFLTGFFWVTYLAIEPFVRRRWPGRIISWSRLLAGDFRDPLVGRDVLVGAVVGTTMLLCQFYLSDLVPRWFGYAPREPWFDAPATRLLGFDSFASGLSNQVFASLVQPFMLLFFLLIFYIALRREWLAALALWALAALALALTNSSSLTALTPATPFPFISAFLVVWVLYRFGLLAMISASFFIHLNIFYPITSDLSAWYAGDFALALALAVALAVYAFRISLAGQPLWRTQFLED